MLESEILADTSFWPNADPAVRKSLARMGATSTTPEWQARREAWEDVKACILNEIRNTRA